MLPGTEQEETGTKTRWTCLTTFTRQSIKSAPGTRTWHWAGRNGKCKVSQDRANDRFQIRPGRLTLNKTGRADCFDLSNNFRRQHGQVFGAPRFPEVPYYRLVLWARFLEARLASSWIKSKPSSQFVSEYEADSLPKCLHGNVENKNGRRSFSFKPVLVAGSEIEMKNSTNPGLA